MYPRILVKPGVVCVACQSVHEHDIDTRLRATIVQDLDAIILAFSDGCWRVVCIYSSQ